MNLKSIVVLCLCLCLYVIHQGVNGKKTLSDEDLEWERELKILNKPPIKTFKNEAGDTVDCVDIFEQPAFDHPLLKNHKIQLQPTSYPKRTRKTSTPSNTKYSTSKTWCPEGSIPRRRMTKEGLKSAKAFTKLYMESFSSTIHPNTGLTPGKHVAIARSVYTPKNMYRGIEGSLNVYNPIVEGDYSNPSSGSHLWIERGTGGARNSIQVGWIVSKYLYSDTRTRSFALWTVGDQGCFDAVCPGFVQTSNGFQLGDEFEPSTYDARVQREVNFRIFQDRVTDNWWFDVPNDNITVGYWPKELFTSLGNGQAAYHVTWGGVVLGQSNGPSPQMGSGHFPDGNYRHGCYVRDMQIVTPDYYMSRPAPPKYQIEMNCDDPSCYGIKDYGYSGDTDGFTFYFGGPGGEKCGP